MATKRMKQWVLGVVLCLCACATSPEPFEYQNTNERKPGRGVFTGEDGTWTIYRQPMPAETEKAPAEDDGAPSEQKASEDGAVSTDKPAAD